MTKTKAEEPLIRLKRDELAIKVSKEIVIKFIEMGKVTPTSFSETFRLIHTEVKRALSD